MKPSSFDYAAPELLEEALTVLAERGDGARVLAGGQSLVPLMALRLAEPDLLVDLRKIPDLRRIEVEDGRVTVAAMVTQTVAGGTPEVHPLVREAIQLIGHPQIRNRGTVGGSLAHADPSAELPAVAVALEAEIVLSTLGGTRAMSADTFFVSHFTAALEKGEILTAVRFPAPRPGEGFAILEVARRRGDFALAGVVVRLVLNGAGVITDASVVSFGVGDRPRVSEGARERLVGAPTSADVLGEAARAAATGLSPPSDLHASGGYRRHAVEVLTRRALTVALRRAEA